MKKRKTAINMKQYFIHKKPDAKWYMSFQLLINLPAETIYKNECTNDSYTSLVLLLYRHHFLNPFTFITFYISTNITYVFWSASLFSFLVLHHFIHTLFYIPCSTSLKSLHSLAYMTFYISWSTSLSTYLDLHPEGMMLYDLNALHGEKNSFHYQHITAKK